MNDMNTASICKCAAALLMAAAATVSCFSDGGETVSKKKYDALEKAYAELREDHVKVQEDYLKSNEELTAILTELAEVSSKTTSLKADVEKGRARLTQAEQISSRITTLKERIAQLEKEVKLDNASNKTLKETVKKMTELVEAQEQELAELKNEIRHRDKTISQQKDTIESRNKTIASQQTKIEEQNEQLRQTVARQAMIIFQAAVDLEEIGDQSPEVKFKKNKEKVVQLQQTIYAKALDYYRQAEAQGYTPATARISALKSKMGK